MPAMRTAGHGIYSPATKAWHGGCARPNGGRDRRLTSLEIRDGVGGIDAEGASDIEEFGDIESALAAFEFRHEGLWPAELLGQGDLGQSCITTGR
jgi:hypothetical protein